jgi:hypothetical protein
MAFAPCHCEGEAGTAVLPVRGRMDGDCRYQGGEHAGGFFGVAMRDEEAAFVVDQQFIEVWLDRIGDAEALCHSGDDGLASRGPVAAGDFGAFGAICQVRRTPISVSVSEPRP